MDVILLEQVKNLGDLGDTVKVRPGYGRNFLLPQGKALPANEANRKVFEERKAELLAKASLAAFDYLIKEGDRLDALFDSQVGQPMAMAS